MKQILQLSQMPRLIMAVTLIVMVGGLFGVLGWSINGSKEIKTKEITVVVSTDKTEYEQGEIIKIQMKSNTSFDYYKIYWPYYEVQKRENGQWKNINRDGCSCSSIKCDVNQNDFKNFSSNEIINETWDQKEVDCDNIKEIDKQVGLGTYRILITVPGYTHNGYNYFYSNEFTIKEKQSDVSITTDKTEYERGEEIKIAVNNGLDKSILYSGYGGRFWDLEYFEDDKWINLAYEERGNFQLTEKNIGNICNMIFYERISPMELLSQLNLTAQWNQKICPLGPKPDKPEIVRYIESGKYKLVFYYGFEISIDDPFQISESKIVYSNEFVIKEKTEKFSNYDDVPEMYSNGSYSIKGFINNAKKLDDTNFVLRGVVNKIYECPSCPEGHDCEFCPPHLYITDSVIEIDNKYFIAINFVNNQDSLDKIKTGDYIEINVNYKINGDGATTNAVPGSLLFLSFYEENLVDFYSCDQDSDCVSINKNCCGCTAGGSAIAINKKAKDKWNEELDCKEIMCPAVISNDTSCFQEPRCENNECVLVKSISKID